MKKKFLTQIMVLSFAVGGLFVVGNNLQAMHNLKEYDDLEAGGITCNQHPGSDARCWIWHQIQLECVWTGNQAHACWIL